MAKPLTISTINPAVSTALCEIGVHYGLPVLFGILTCNTLEQAIARSGGKVATTGKDDPEARKKGTRVSIVHWPPWKWSTCWQNCRGVNEQ